MNASKYEQERREYLNKKYGMNGLEAVLEYGRPSKLEINEKQEPSGPSPAQKYVEEKKARFNLPNGLELEGTKPKVEPVTVKELESAREYRETVGSRLVASKPKTMEKNFWFEVKI